MFLDATYVILRRKGADGAEIFSDLDVVLPAHRIVMVAVRHPRFTAEQSQAATAAAFAAIGVASLAGVGAVDVSPTGVTKAVAVAKEMAEHGCAAEATAVFGDMPNDLPLFAWSGWACAVANGHPDVLAAADKVGASNDNNGVARSVRRLLRLAAVQNGSPRTSPEDQASQ